MLKYGFGAVSLGLLWVPVFMVSAIPTEVYFRINQFKKRKEEEKMMQFLDVLLHENDIKLTLENNNHLTDLKVETEG